MPQSSQTPGSGLARARAAALADLARNEGVTPSRWRVIITDSESPTGLAPVCSGDNSDALHMIHDFPGGPKRDEDGVYDCCPWPQIETYSEAWATYLVELLNADAEHAQVRAEVLTGAADKLDRIGHGAAAWILRDDAQDGVA